MHLFPNFILFWNETLHVLDSSSVHHQEFFTVHTAMVYVIQFCWQLVNRIRMEHSLYTQQRYMSYSFADSLWTGSGCSILILLTSCMKYTIAVCTVKNSWWWTEELSETWREFHSKNKFEKLVHVVGFILRKLLTLLTVNWSSAVKCAVPGHL